MVQCSTVALDASFAALSDGTRRGILEVLGRADSSISDLAARFRMSLPGMSKHIVLLERAGLVATEKVGRVRTCRLGPSSLASEAAWLENHRRLWAERFDALDRVIATEMHKETLHGRDKPD
jgi:DNA-binding transcriptional ArsR family regulator